MAIRRIYEITYRGTKLRGGHFYTFDYDRYENDPSPMILLMYEVKGIHPRTKHYHSYLQGWNLSYIPKKLRRAAVEQFMRMAARKRPEVAFSGWKYDAHRKHIRIGWKWFPAYMELAIRRYLTAPPGHIKGLKEIPFEYIETALMDIEHKDYFRKAAAQRARRLLQRNVFRISKKKKRRRR